MVLAVLAVWHLRAAWHRDDYKIVQINEVAGDAHAAAHLLKYDSVHGTWDKAISAEESGTESMLAIDGQPVALYPESKYCRHRLVRCGYGG